MVPEVTAAIITASASLILAIISIIQSSAQRKKLHRQQVEIENTKHRLDIRKSELDARLDYEYEAKKKLYEKYEPLFFQFTEYASQAQNHIKGMSWTTFNPLNKKEEWDKNTWMDKSNYYFRETIYKIFCPLAVMKLINNILNSVDVRIDNKIYLVYRLGKILHVSFQQDYRIAENMSDKIEVEEEHLVKFGNFEVGKPFGKSYHAEWQKNVTTNPENFKSGEGIRTGQFETLLKGFIKHDGDKERVITFNEFEQLLAKKESPKWLKIAEIRFAKFDPKVNKILWRLLVLQACLHYTILGIKDSQYVDVETVKEKIGKFISNAKQNIDEKNAGYKGNVQSIAEQHDIIDSVQKYLNYHLKTL